VVTDPGLTGPEQGDPQLADADLVRAALLGLKAPMAELLRRHWETAVALATRVLGSPDLARDAAQEAAIAAMTDLGRLRSPDRFGAWFCGIALNVARRWLRQLRPEVWGLAAGLPYLPSADPDPAEAAELADIAERVRDAIAALADGQRDAVRLFYLQGLSHREVAAELGISVGAVKARLHQARAALAPRLASLTATRLTGPQLTGAQLTGAQLTRAQLAAAHKEETMTTPDAVEWTEVYVKGIARSQEEEENEDPSDRALVMILAERDGERTLPIWIGLAEATVLALALESVETPRPFTYKLAAGLVEAAGSRIGEVRITRLTEGIFYAAVIVPGPAGAAPQAVDARPSDAVNLAVVCGAPILLNSELFETAADCDPANRRELRVGRMATAEIAAETQQRAAARHRKYRGERAGAEGKGTEGKKESAD
jgi:RNA polymerase sigma factor (sigma-70 family)